MGHIFSRYPFHTLNFVRKDKTQVSSPFYQFSEHLSSLSWTPERVSPLVSLFLL